MKFSELCWYRLISWDVIVTDISKNLEGQAFIEECLFQDCLALKMSTYDDA
jgi:hypothetical protein